MASGRATEADRNGGGSPASGWENVSLARILSSRPFCKSQQLKSILAYLCESAKEGRAPTETEIGRNILDRPDFDPGTDSLVRVHMRRLRQKLYEYYKDEGAADPFRIEIANQGYNPVVNPVGDQAGAPDVPRRPKSIFRDWRVCGALATATLVFGFAGWSVGISRGRGIKPSPAEALVRHGLYEFWAPFIETKSQPILAISTPLFFKRKDMYVRDYRLNFMDDLRYRPKPLSSSVAWPVWKTWISYSDAESAVRITGFLGAYGKSASMTTGREIRQGDLEKDPVIFLGHPRGVPILDDFFASRNFYPYRAGPGRPYHGIGNRAPRSGEQKLYWDFESSLRDDIDMIAENAPDYALLTFSKPQSAPARLSVFGQRPLSTGLLINWLMDSDLLNHLAVIGIRPPFAEFQVLFKVRIVNGVPIEAQPIASRSGEGGRTESAKRRRPFPVS